MINISTHHSQTHITFIGGGNMGRALISGLLANGFNTQQLTVVEANTPTSDALHRSFGIHVISAIDQITLDLSKNHVVVMAIKPQDFKQVAKDLSVKFSDIPDLEPLILSIAAGIRLLDICRWFKQDRCVRAMPNTPALIGQGITGLYANPSVSVVDCALAETICQAVGQTVWVTEEKLMDAITAISGSGPAYVFAFLEALQASGEKLGLDTAIARQLAYETLAGAIALAKNSIESAGVLRERVTSKGGTTAAALVILQQYNWQAALEAAVVAAYHRGQALGEELGET
jgi:pyrroline-5-carboxylate reductase